jgi:hypothetical protein
MYKLSLLIRIFYKVLTGLQAQSAQASCKVYQRATLLHLPRNNIYVHFFLQEIEFESVYPLWSKQNSQWQSLLFIELIVVLL